MSLLGKWLPESDLELSRAAAVKIGTHYPAKMENKLKSIGGKKRLTGILDVVMGDIEKYQRQHRMGWIRKARFGNELKWRLKETGYSEEFVDAIVEGVVARLTTVDRAGQA